jgi:mRNA interferase MazF
MTIYDRGHVIVVNVPFTGQGGSKRRPALVVSTRAFHARLPDLIAIPISSQPRFHRRPGPGDLPLGHWKSAGLRRPSTARISNILALEKALVDRVLGKLHDEDMELVKRGLEAAFGL